jgi:hypothetical protein
VTTGDEVALRLAANLSLEPREVADLLVSDERAPRGTCHRLIVLRTLGVQCLPEDSRLATLRIEIDRTATAWTLSGHISRASAENAQRQDLAEAPGGNRGSDRPGDQAEIRRGRSAAAFRDG